MLGQVNSRQANLDKVMSS